MRRLNPLPALVRLAARIDLAIRLKRALGNSWGVSWKKAERS